jgi:hypothetical protein
MIRKSAPKKTGFYADHPWYYPLALARKNFAPFRIMAIQIRDRPERVSRLAKVAP